ncbi:hypothetical protein D7004_04875 [Pedobacter jejuensis]|uniref:Uncharacterized protein n=1 Tax=Pedobacter jejuensis TaxID=1268550 RepID=A0A3N0C066_9SPHI|nr:hypothetical protein D7004_04875 [Pedobacter jejuensis]
MSTIKKAQLANFFLPKYGFKNDGYNCSSLENLRAIDIVYLVNKSWYLIIGNIVNFYKNYFNK